MGRRGGRASVKNMELEGFQMADPLPNDQPKSSNPSLEGAKANNEGAAELKNGSRKEILESKKANPRRSQRVQHTILYTQARDIEPVVENIDLSGNEEDDQQHIHQVTRNAESVLGMKSLEDKIDYAVKILESHDKMLEALKLKGADWYLPTQATTLVGTRSGEKKNKYKEMYIDSQKKIEILREENYQLGKKLENALGRLEAYEKGQIFCSEAIEKLRDTMLISSLAKTTERVLDLSASRSGRTQVAKRGRF
ncbi:PREDICTED: uncharacterized protein LOC104596475 [Nelumbo nucifera]|uniref:Uncharacterized protein LOC104596475 n=2 Tax=Nelumbo nucifera TaxID=4432 RepID=A0A1U8A2Q2_NELNU|nr:PREDICTED: uncharacterized protein LOC104596475 [Nelumbo nucifera]DAD19474.1 TPA_asm: hypothetical protein HUJ06_020937 [Nelumbo nucifera]